MRSQRGISLIEVLVSMIILAVGLLALVILQGRLQVLQVESYQRSQALVLLHDMASRIALNRNNAAAYAAGAPVTAPVGVGMTCASGATREEQDVDAWCRELQGAAETSGTTNVGAMVGGRGCVEALGSDSYMVTVAWQGLAPLSAPPASVDCGANLYNGAANTPCQGDMCRRVVTTVVQIADLNNAP